MSRAGRPDRGTLGMTSTSDAIVDRGRIRERQGSGVQVGSVRSGGRHRSGYRGGASVAILAALACLSACGGSLSPERGSNTLDSAALTSFRDQDPHAALYLEDRYPSASTCRTCHPNHYRQWSASPHAYAQLSPVFNAMHGTILMETNGTNGDFCIRCHTPVGMAIEEPLFASNLDRHPTSREGITCIVCHRVNEARGKVSGRRRLLEGDLLEPIYGPTGNSELERVIASSEYKVVTDRTKRGRRIHTDARRFFQLQTPAFCGSCHDVTLPDGFRLEEAFSEYESSPAASRGETCQDCHMGTEPGVAEGYDRGSAAIVGGIPTRIRRLSHHGFAGPDHSIVHPGIFPHNPEAQELASLRDWLTFDWEAGWGTDAFEDEEADDTAFPERWASADDRYDAREVLDQQQSLLAEAEARRLALLRRGYRLADVRVTRQDRGGASFEVTVESGTDGHNVPTGFIAERLVFLRVTVRDESGQVVMQSGDLDPNGDLRDHHSLYVHNGELPVDDQLFTLQSKFLTRNIRGGEREQVLAINHSVDALPFVRPSTFASILKGNPAGGRIHRITIEPGGRRRASYELPAEIVKDGSRLTVDVELIAGMVPVNLVAEIKDVGFDYGLSPRKVADRIVAGHQLLWKKSVTIDVE